MRIDAHQHYWKTERNDYGWLTPESGPLYADYMPDDLRPHLQANGIDKTIVVQAAPTVAETEFLLSLCEREKTLAGVVGWLDLDADDFPEQFARLRSNRYFVGIRPMLQDLDDDAWILRPRVIQSLKRLADEQFPIDLLIFPRHLPHIITLLEQLPGLRAVIDHLAKPGIKDGVLDPWRDDIAAIARHANVYCKLSGMVTEADMRHWKTADFVPYVHHVFDVFGPQRVMFGSDWPVCLLAADYSQVCRLLADALPQRLSERDRSAIFGGNAIDFYKLEVL